MSRVPMPDRAKLLEAVHDKPRAASTPYSDITQRACDRKLLAQQTAVAEDWKKKKERRTVETPWCNKDGTPKHTRDVPLWKCPPPPPSPVLRLRSPPQPAPHAMPTLTACMARTPGLGSPLGEEERRNGKGSDEVMLTKPAEGALPDAGAAVAQVGDAAAEAAKAAVAQETLERRRRRSAPNPILPSELLPQLMPGVRRELLSAATKRAQRANQRRKDALKLLKAAVAAKSCSGSGVSSAVVTVGSTTAADADSFDRPRSPAVTDVSKHSSDEASLHSPTHSDADDDGDEAFAMSVLRGKPIVVTTHDASAIDEGLIQYAVRQPDTVSSSSGSAGGDEDPDEMRGATDPATPVGRRPTMDPSLLRMVPPPDVGMSPGFQKLLHRRDLPLKSRSLPETHGFLHEVRMQRRQQAHWAPFNPALRAATPQAQPPTLKMLPLGSLLKRPDSAASFHPGPSQPMGLHLNFANLNQRGSTAATATFADDDVTFELEAVRRNSSFSTSKASLPPRGLTLRSADLHSVDSYAQEPTRSRPRGGGGPDGTASECPSSPLIGRGAWRASSTSPFEVDDRVFAEESIGRPMRLQRTPSSFTGDGDDGGDGEEMLRTTLPKTRRSSSAVDYDLLQQQRNNAKPFVLPSTFLRYKGEKISAVVTGVSDVQTKSTPEHAPVVKLIWGSAPSDAQPSDVARTADHMLAIEVVFRTNRHVFDAQHIRSLLGSNARYVADMEAGNRGGHFVALYGRSRLQLLKGVASLMTKIQNGESPLFSQAFNAARPCVDAAMLLESPRSLDELPLEETQLPKRRRDPEVRITATSDTWLKRNSVAGQDVNLHAPGALEQFLAQQAKKKEQNVRRRRLAGKLGGLFASTSIADSMSGTASLFIAEGDAVPLAITQMQERDAAEAHDEAVRAATGDAKTAALAASIATITSGHAGEAASDAKDPFGSFTMTSTLGASAMFENSVASGGYMRLQGDLVHKIDRSRGSIIGLIQDAEMSLEALRKARARQILEGAMRRMSGRSTLDPPGKGIGELCAPPRPIRRLSTRNLRQVRDEECRAALAEVTTGQRRMSFHELAAQVMKEQAAAAAATASPPKAAGLDGSGSDTSWASLKSSLKKKKSKLATVVVNAMETSTGGGGGSSSSTVLAEAPPPDPAYDAARVAAQHAIDRFEAFVATHCVHDKIAVIVPLTEFKDPAIAPTPMAESDAEDLTFLLQQLDYHVIVMLPPPHIPAPDPYDATPEEEAAYEEQMAKQQEQWFLVPTAENITKLIEAFVYRSRGTFHSNVALFLLTRGYIGPPEIPPNASAARYVKNETQVALTFDSSLQKLKKGNVLVASELIASCRQSTCGRQPMVFIDAYPVYENPNADAHILYEYHLYQEAHSNVVVGGKGKQPGALSANGFVYFSAMPEDGGDTLSSVYPRHVGGLGAYYLKRALEGRALPPNSLRLTMSSLIYYLSAKLQARGCRVAHNAQGTKGHTQLRNYYDFGEVYESYGELREAFKDSHEIEVKGEVRINLQLQVKIDMGYYNCQDLQFLPRSEYWWKQLRKELHRLLYPKPKTAASAAEDKAKGKTKVAKADRVRFCCAVASNQSVSVEYLGLVDVVLNDRKLRILEKDFSKVADRCWALQEGKETGYIFHGAPPIPPPLHLRPLSDFESAGAKSMRSILTLSRRSSSYFNSVMRAMRQLVPAEVQYPLASGFVEVYLQGQQRRAQQNFAIQYFHAGTQKQTPVGTTPVTLNRRPAAVYGTVLLTVIGTRRDARKLDRIARQQLLRHTNNVIIERVELDPFEPHEHSAALKVQRRFRGHTVRRVLYAQRRMLEDEAERRNDIFTDEDVDCEALIEAALLERNILLVKWEAANRQEITWAEYEERLYLLAMAIKYLVQQQGRGRSRILVEEIVHVLPLAEGINRVALECLWLAELEVLAVLNHFNIGLLWDHFYLQSDYYQEVLRVRNACREQSKTKIVFGYMFPRPEPPCTLMDRGYSIIRGLLEERAGRRALSPAGRLRKL